MVDDAHIVLVGGEEEGFDVVFIDYFPYLLVTSCVGHCLDDKITILPFLSLQLPLQQLCRLALADEQGSKAKTSALDLSIDVMCDQIAHQVDRDKDAAEQSQ